MTKEVNAHNDFRQRLTLRILHLSGAKAGLKAVTSFDNESGIQSSQSNAIVIPIPINKILYTMMNCRVGPIVYFCQNRIYVSISVWNITRL